MPGNKNNLATAQQRNAISRHMGEVFVLMALGALVMAGFTYIIPDDFFIHLQIHGLYLLILLLQLSFVFAIYPRVNFLSPLASLFVLIESSLANTLIFVPLSNSIFGVSPILAFIDAAIIFILMAFVCFLGRAPKAFAGFMFATFVGIITVLFTQLFIAPQVGLETHMDGQLALGFIVVAAVAGFSGWNTLEIKSMHSIERTPSLELIGSLRGAVLLALDHLYLTVQIPYMVMSEVLDLLGVKDVSVHKKKIKK